MVSIKEFTYSRYKKEISILCSIICLFFIIKPNQNYNPPIRNDEEKLLPKWQNGYLDIHHINTGSGNATFFIFPDATTMLFDAGDLNKEKFEEKYAPLKATSPVPNSSKSTTEWLAKYVNQFIPKKRKASIDYALISHFHQDHYASFTSLYDKIPFETVIDRGYPDYNFPLDIKKYLKNDEIFQKYIDLVNKKNVKKEKLKPASDTQIKLLHEKSKYPDFKVQNIKANATIWTGKKNETIEYFTPHEMLEFYNGKYNENPLSLAIKVVYGNFDYYTGGDNTGLQGYGLPKWFDVETPIANAVGKVEVMTLNHHGNRDATNQYFVQKLNPKVAIQQLWCSDHPGQEVYQRLIYNDEKTEKTDIFSTNMHQETLVTYGPWFSNNYKSKKGHILVRVYPKGLEYKVFILDETNYNIKNEYGPYKSN